MGDGRVDTVVDASFTDDRGCRFEPWRPWKFESCKAQAWRRIETWLSGWVGLETGSFWRAHSQKPRSMLFKKLQGCVTQFKSPQKLLLSSRVYTVFTLSTSYTLSCFFVWVSPSDCTVFLRDPWLGDYRWYIFVICERHRCQGLTEWGWGVKGSGKGVAVTLECRRVIISVRAE